MSAEMAQVGTIQWQGVTYKFRLEHRKRKPSPAFESVSKCSQRSGTGWKANCLKVSCSSCRVEKVRKAVRQGTKSIFGFEMGEYGKGLIQIYLTQKRNFR